MTLYQELKAAGCKIDSHESDLYVEATMEARAIVKKHRCKAYPFISQTDRGMWLDVPFMFDPWWKARAR